MLSKTRLKAITNAAYQWLRDDGAVVAADKENIIDILMLTSRQALKEERELIADWLEKNRHTTMAVDLIAQLRNQP